MNTEREPVKNKPTGLMVNLMSEPTGVDCQDIRFSWIMNSQEKDTRQTACRILVSASREKIEKDMGDVWDSGLKVSDASIHVPYEGKPLKENTLYYWKVQTVSNHGIHSPFSEPAVFVTGYKNWEAGAIWLPGGEEGHRESNVIFARRSFTVRPVPVASAVLSITAAKSGGTKQYTYKAYLNGTLVGMGPQFAVYDDRWIYNVYDVTSFLCRGENAVGAVCYALEEKKLQAESKIIYADGGCEVVKTDGSWRILDGTRVYGEGSASIGTSYYTAMAENIDARVYPFGWDRGGFDDSGWQTAAVKPGIERLSAAITDPMKTFEISPREIKPMAEGEYLIDFGREIVGGLKLEFREIGIPLTIEIRYGEELENGRVRYEMRTGNTYREFITLSQGDQTIENFGFKCFRYAEIVNAPAAIQEGGVRAVAVHLPIDEGESFFRSDNEVLDEVYDLCKYSLIATSQDVLVDSQSRERGPYEGDLYVNQLGLYCVARQYNLARYTNRYLIHKPTWCQEYHQLSILSAWEDYMYTGDKSALALLYPLLKQKLLDYRTCYHNEQGLYFHNIFGNSQDAALIDWPDSQRDGYRGSDYITVVNVFQYMGARLLSAIAGVLGIPEEEAFYGRLSGELRRGILTLYDAEAHRFADGKYADGMLVSHWAQHASFFPLAFGILDGDPALAGEIASQLQRDGVKCSIYGIQYLLLAMYRAGMDDFALELLTGREEKKSWYHVIHRLGATITPESWDPSLKANMTFSHAWGTAPANIIVRSLCGIMPAEPGCGKMTVRPRIGFLKKVQVKAPTMRGYVFMEIDLPGQSMTVELPANSAADIYVPCFYAGARKALMDDREVPFEKSGKYFLFRDVGSGVHKFTQGL